MDIQINDLPYDIYDSDRKIRYFTKNGKFFFKVNLYLTGMDLPFVENVTYFLHKSFPTPQRWVHRSLSNQHCILTMWAWGKFEVRTIVKDTKGNGFSYNHFLNFDSHFYDKGVEFVKVIRK